MNSVSLASYCSFTHVLQTSSARMGSLQDVDHHQKSSQGSLQSRNDQEASTSVPHPLFSTRGRTIGVACIHEQRRQGVQSQAHPTMVLWGLQTLHVLGIGIHWHEHGQRNQVRVSAASSVGSGRLRDCTLAGRGGRGAPRLVWEAMTWLEKPQDCTSSVWAHHHSSSKPYCLMSCCA